MARAKAKPTTATAAKAPTAPTAAFKPQPATLPPGSLEAVLHGLLREHGARVYEDRRLFRSFMADGLGSRMSEHQLAVNTMALLVEEGLPARMAAARPDKFDELLQHEAARLARLHGLRPEVAGEAVRCWAAALRPELPTGPAPASAPPTMVTLVPTPSATPAPSPPPKPKPIPASRPPSTRIVPAPAPAPLIVPAPSVPTAPPVKPGWGLQKIVAVAALAALIWFMTRPADAPPRRPGPSTPAPAVVFVGANSPAEATTDKPWSNSLGMRFVPVAGTEVLFSVWDTRVQDYEAFAQAQGGVDSQWHSPGFTQASTHPVVKVSWDDAQAFAKWLTEKERREGKIPATASYRLPQDWAWSVAVGLNEAQAGTPREKDGTIKDVYPWGTQWPPPVGAGNYSPYINVDSFANTSPVGSFAANKFGLYDMGGNVSQWCEDLMGDNSGSRVLRGGSWGDGTPRYLLSSNRNNFNPVTRFGNNGFRLVLVVGALP